LGRGRAEIKKGKPMRLQGWEEIVQSITDDCKDQQKRENQVLVGWRARLEKEPTLLRPHQIDEIVRAVRQRLDDRSPSDKETSSRTPGV
jgi:hypothetical protein